MENLGKIFGSPYRVKIMRLFLFNESSSFDIDDVVLRSMVKKPDARKELTMLTKIAFLKRKSFSKKIPNKITKVNPKQTYRRVKKEGWVLNPKFDLIGPLRSLLIDSELVREQDIITRIKKAGSIKLLMLSGIFLKDENRKLDILVVGDKLKRDSLDSIIAKLESEIGRELSYAVFDSSEFKYRVSMYDKLIRDVVDNKHRSLINKIYRT